MFKNTLLILLLVLINTAYAITVDPNDEPTKTLVCTSPIADTRGDPLPTGSVLQIKLHTSTGVTGPWTVVDTKTVCSFVVDTTTLSETRHYYQVTASLNGIDSAFSNQQVIDIVVTITPKAPANLVWQ